MAWPARSNQGSTDAAKDVIPITASAANNVFGKPYTATVGGDARACKALLASELMTITCVTAAGVTRTAVPLSAGWNPLQVIQVIAISGGTLWAAI